MRNYYLTKNLTSICLDNVNILIYLYIIRVISHHLIHCLIAY